MKSTMMRMMMLLLIALSGSGCSTYQLGSPARGPGMKEIHAVYVPTVANESDDTWVPLPMTNAILQEMNRDGTFRPVRKEEGDAILEVTVQSVERSPIRQSTQQFLTTLQYQLIVTLEYRMFDLHKKAEIVPKTKVQGSTTFFVQGDQTESQRQAFPLAAQNAAQNLITALANRGW